MGEGFWKPPRNPPPTEIGPQNFRYVHQITANDKDNGTPVIGGTTPKKVNKTRVTRVHLSVTQNWITSARLLGLYTITTPTPDHSHRGREKKGGGRDGH